MNRCLLQCLLLLTIVTSSYSAFGQAPTISSFSPASGPIGTSVVITGTNFNPTAANNTVFFGAAQGVVTSASATSLTVTVPTAANYAPITVLNNGLIAYSRSSFLITFSGGSGITAATLDPKVDLGTGVDPRIVVIADLDGDGKADLMAASANSNAISVFRNTAATIGTVSYNPKQDFATGTNPRGIATGDVDGDGKTDLIVSNYDDNTVSVLRNTSSIGTISFLARVNFGTGSVPSSIAIGDADSDGKADIVATNFGTTTVSVLRNTSVGPGSISFAGKSDFLANTSPIAAALSDVDGDGKADLIVVNQGNNNISVLLNTSVGPGSINFATKSDFTTGANPFAVAVGDLDGDGKQDIAVTNDNSTSVSIFRNTSPGAGNINFAGKADFTAGANPESVAIGDLDGDGKADLAVANTNSNTMSAFRNTSPGAGTISFAPKVDFTTGTNPRSVVIGDVDGDGKADVAVADFNDDAVSVFRNTVGTAFITNVLIPNVSMKVGDVVTATITVRSDAATYTLVAGSNIDGFALGSLAKVNSTTYTAQFTVTNGGTDIPAASSVPVHATLSGPFGNGNIYTTSITQASDPIDANSPAAFTTGIVVTTGGTIVAGFWNSTNTGINVSVPIASDASLTGGTVQVQAKVSAGTFANLGSAATIIAGDLGGTKTIIITATQFEAITAFADGQTINFAAIITDAGGNATTGAQSTSTLFVDQAAPALSLTLPAASAVVNNARVSYTRSENLASGTITWTRTAGNADPGSPHVQTLVGAELTANQSNYTLTNNPTLVNGATYSVSFDGTDAAGNAATGAISTNVQFVSTPTVQASAVNFTAVTTTTITVNWTNGNGARRVVLIHQGAAVDSNPVNGIAYTANTSFGSGTQIGAGNYVVYDGTGSSVTVTGLTAGTTYHVAVFEYNGSGTTSTYFTPGATGSQLTTTTASASSDIIPNGLFTYPASIPYANFQENVNIVNSGTSIIVAKFDLRDGGAFSDADALPTVLTALSLDLGSNFNLIRRIALYDAAGTTELTGTNEQAVGTQVINFSGLSLSTIDDAALGFTVRVSYKSVVTDNQQYTFTITAASAQAGNSQFVSPNAGGSTTSTSGNNNRIAVTATTLQFVQQPSNTATNVAMTPPVTVAAVDANGNRDLDFGAAVALTSTGTLTGAPVSTSFVAGLGSYASLVHTASGTGLTLSTTNASGVSNTISSPFNITSNTPTISNVTIPNVSMKIGSVVVATITVLSDPATYTLVGSSIDGFALSSLNKVDNATYTAQFTVTAGGADVAAGGDIPLSVILNGAGGNSNTYTTVLSQANDPIDANAPVFSTTAPASGTVITNTQVSYTISETIASGAITFTQTGGTADPGSPHTQSLTGTELASGAHSNITLSNNPSLVSGAVYSIAFAGSDAAGNPATPVLNTNVTYSPVVAPLITDATIPDAPMKIGSVVVVTITVSSDPATYTLLSSDIDGFALSGLSKINNTTYTAQFTVTPGGTDIAAGADIPVSITLNGPGGNSNNHTASFTQGNDPIDANAPVFSGTSPASSSVVSGTQVSYTLTETITSGSITFTQTGGTTDPGSPHAQSLTGTELSAGAHSNITLSSNPALVNGAIYAIAFAGSDAAGNPATTVTNTNVTFSSVVAPVITDVSIPNVAMKVGSNVVVSIKVAGDAATYTLVSSTIDGFAVSGLSKTSNTSYTAQFTVTNGGVDIAAGADIPVNLILNGPGGNSNTFTTPISQPGDPIDANIPVITATSPSSGSNVTNAAVSYTLSSDIKSGTITWTRTGGVTDVGSPHVQNLTGTELSSGAHSSIILSASPNLVNGAVYTVTFNGTDAAGNIATPVTNTTISFGTIVATGSDIIANTSFTYPSNIAYTGFQEATDITNSTTSVAVAKFDIRDGGGANDADALATNIASITLDLGRNSGFIRRIALYDAAGSTEISGTDKSVTAQAQTFNGLTLSAPDDGILSFTVRVSFTTAVTDNEAFQLTVSSVTLQSSSSGIKSPDAGGAQSSIAGDNNRIEVLATQLAFVQQPTSTVVDKAMSPAVTVQSIDANLIRDVDDQATVSLSSTGSLKNPLTTNLNNGLASFAEIIHSAAGQGFELTATQTGMISAISNEFNIESDLSGLVVKIHNVITPSSIDDKNNVLVIDNIDFFPNNTVHLLDRYGASIKKWVNFVNYASTDPEQGDFDFTQLTNGNYICTVEYTDPATGEKLKAKPQMITVLK